ncbi:MAG TPA: YfhO family protein, partial [Caulifigura sp.]|nr:YfhO family protein [Caulifigura sp.]
GRALWPVIAAVAFGVTTFDLSYVHECVTYLTFLDRSPLSLLNESPIGMHLRGLPTPVRVFAPGPNLPTMMRVNCVPEYLGIGPKPYFDRQLAIPRYPAEKETPELRAALIEWLQRAGVTHVLSQQPIDATAWPVSNAMQAMDSFLNAAWGRGREPMSLDSLVGSRSRVFLEDAPDGKGVTIQELRDEAIALEVESNSTQRLIVLDLPYPGWEVTIDGEPAEAGVYEGMYRSVRVPSGRHRVEWAFIPRSFYRGLMVFAAAAISLFVWMWMEWKRGGRVR